MDKAALDNVIEAMSGGKVPKQVKDALALVIEKGLDGHDEVLNSCLKLTDYGLVAQVVSSVLRAIPHHAHEFMEGLLSRWQWATRALVEGSALGLFEARCMDGWSPDSHFVAHFPDYVFRIVTADYTWRHDSSYQGRLENAVKDWVHKPGSEARGLMVNLARHYANAHGPSDIGRMISDAIAFKVFSSLGCVQRMEAVADGPQLYVFVRSSSGNRSGLIGCVHYSAKEALIAIRTHKPDIDEQLLYPDKPPQGRDLMVGDTIDIVG